MINMLDLEILALEFDAMAGQSFWPESDSQNQRDSLNTHFKEKEGQSMLHKW